MGKKYKFVIWGVLCFSYLIAIFHRMSMGVIQADLEGTFGMNALTFASLSAVFFYVYMIMQVPAGLMADFLGVRKTASAGMILASAGSVIFGFSPTVTMLFIGRFLVSAGVSVIFVCILKFQSSWFHEKEFGTLTGITGVVSNLGAITAQTPLVALVLLVTWRYSFAVIGILGIIAALLCYLVVRNSPEKAGLHIVSAAVPLKQDKEKQPMLKPLWEVIKNPHTWPASIVYGAFYGSLLTLTGTWGPSYLVNVYGISMISAANRIIIIIVGAAAASFAAGWASDRLARRKLPMILMGALYLACWIVLTVFFKGKPPFALLPVLFFIMGFSAPAYVLSWACGKEANHPHYAGISTAVVNSGGIAGAAIVPMLFGRLLDRYSGMIPIQQLYNKAFFMCLVFAAAGFAATFLVKETNCRNIYFCRRTKGTGGSCGLSRS